MRQIHANGRPSHMLLHRTARQAACLGCGDQVCGDSCARVQQTCASVHDAKSPSQTVRVRLGWHEAWTIKVGRAKRIAMQGTVLTPEPSAKLGSTILLDRAVIARGAMAVGQEREL